MNRGLETAGTTPIDVLAVGDSEWLRSATATLDGDAGTAATATVAVDVDIDIDGPIETPLDPTGDRLEAADCLLTDDPAVLSALGSLESLTSAGSETDAAIVYVVDPAECESIDALRADGATEIIDRSSADKPALLVDRLRQAVRFATARRRASRREWLESLLEDTSGMVSVLDDAGRITYADPSAERLVGYEPAALVGEHFAEYVHPEDVSTARDAFRELCRSESGTTTTVEYRCRHADGNWYVHEAGLTNRLDDGDGDGNVVEDENEGEDEIDGVVASVRDVTETARIQQEFDESFERVSDAFYALDSDWRFTYLNDRAAERFDVEPADALGERIHDRFPGLRGTAFQTAAIEAMENQESRSLERYFEPTDSWYDVTLYPSPSGLSVYFRDVTERVERERQLRDRTERLEALVENVPVILFAFRPDGEITLAEGRALEGLETVSDDVVGESVFDVFDDHDGIRSLSEAALEGETTEASVTLDGRVFEAWCRPIVADGDGAGSAGADGDEREGESEGDGECEVERVIGTAVDVTERAQYQEALNALHEATTHLLTVDSEQAACEYTVDVAADVLDLETVFYRFDEADNVLVPAAVAPGLESTIGRPPDLEPGGSIAWRTFIADDSQRFADVRTADCVADPSTSARSGLYVPIGEHGVLVALAPERDRYDDDTFELARLFARTAEAALDRIARARRLHGREGELKRQNRRLERLNAAGQVRQDIEQLLLLADSRAEIEAGVCKRLADVEGCSFAWLGEPDPGGNQLLEQARAGHDRGYLEAITAAAVDDDAAEPAGRAARSRAPVYVANVAGAVREGTWRGEALSRTVQSVYAVPLVYDGFLYGVVTCYGDDGDAFDDPFREMLAELGETIAYAIDAVKRKSGLDGDGNGVAVVELELEFESELPLCRLADRLETPVEFEGATVRDDGVPTVFAAVDGTDIHDRIDGLTDLAGIGAASVIAETDSKTLLQLRYTDPFVGSVVDGHGGMFRTLHTDGDVTRAIIDVPETIEIRDLVSALSRRGFATTMVARRDQPSDRSTIDTATRNALLERLTDRQREVVQTAYYSGFFEWPRVTTGEAVAESLSISSPAFHRHVRTSERKLFSALFDGSVSGG